MNCDTSRAPEWESNYFWNVIKTTIIFNVLQTLSDEFHTPKAYLEVSLPYWEMKSFTEHNFGVQDLKFPVTAVVVQVGPPRKYTKKPSENCGFVFVHVMK